MKARSGITVAGFLAALLAVPVAEAQAATPLKVKALNTAAAQKGDPYQYGAAGPSRFDCSGLVYYSYRQHGKTLARTAQGQYNKSRKISRSSRQPGDLVFFGGTYSIYHVGIYAGNGYIWHSPKPGRRVEKVKLWTSNVRYGRY